MPLILILYSKLLWVLAVLLVLEEKLVVAVVTTTEEPRRPEREQLAKGKLVA